MDCNVDTGRLREISDRYELDGQVEYLRRYIRFTRKPIERQSYTSCYRRTSCHQCNDAEGFRWWIC